MKFVSLYDGKQIGSVYSAAMTFTEQQPFNPDWTAFLSVDEFSPNFGQRVLFA